MGFKFGAIPDGYCDQPRWLQTVQANAKMIMQVHDKLAFETAEDCLEDCIAKIRVLMCAAVELAARLLVDACVGGNWDEAHWIFWRL
ncbi:hypothetical protein JCM14076_12310 [Methylosoma difficile]